MEILIRKKVDNLGRLPIPLEVRTALWGTGDTAGMELDIDVVDGKLIGTPTITRDQCPDCGRPV